MERGKGIPKPRGKTSGSKIYGQSGAEWEGREVVYYESLKRDLKTKTIYGCRCDERLKN